MTLVLGSGAGARRVTFVEGFGARARRLWLVPGSWAGPGG
jgi:hypothetical protein